MGRSKKGRLTGAARKEINDRRARDAIDGVATDVAFARVTKILGSNHLRVMLPSDHAPVEVSARIPNILARRGATPITVRDVVTIYVGNDFDVNANDFATAHFDITSILTGRQAYNLYKDGLIPKWMVHEEGRDIDHVDEDGFEFDHSGAVEEDAPAQPRRSRPAEPAEVDDDVDIDDI
jgi:translation initiation factor IF-1